MPNKLSRKFEAGTVAFAAGFTLALGGCATGGAEGRPAAASTSQAGEPTPDKTPTTEAPAPNTGDKYSPDALAEIVNDHEALVAAFHITGKTPEEVAANTQASRIGFVMSGTAKADLDAFRGNGGQLSGPDMVKYIEERGKLYETVACEGMFGDPGCVLTNDMHNLHEINMALHALNHDGEDGAAKFGEDFSIGPDTIVSVEVTEGSFDSGSFTLEYTTDSSNNFAGSAAEKLAKNMEGIDDTAAQRFASVQNWTGRRTIVQPYHKVGDHYETIADGSGSWRSK